jgi:hypothetical protein
MNLQEAKEVLSIHSLWSRLNLPGKASKSCIAPHRKDRNPSFSVYDNGRKFKDFGTNQSGDAIDFLQLVLGVGRTQACSEFLNLAKSSASARAKPRKRTAKNNVRPSLSLDSNLRKGLDWDLRKLSDRRNIGIQGLQLATNRGFLRFGEGKLEGIWSLVDLDGVFRQDRLLNGELIAFKSGGRAKARTLGTLSCPLGHQAVAGYRVLLLVEGGPDFLAAHHLISNTACPDEYGVVGMLGVGHRFNLDDMNAYNGKRIRIFPHMDASGISASIEWERALIRHGANTDVYDFHDLETQAGEPVSDLNDFLNVNVEAWERDEQVRNPLPEIKEK